VDNVYTVASTDANAFYLRHGFVELPLDPLTVWLALEAKA
jgi:hypothetical protein